MYKTVLCFYMRSMFIVTMNFMSVQTIFKRLHSLREERISIVQITTLAEPTSCPINESNLPTALPCDGAHGTEGTREWGLLGGIRACCLPLAPVSAVRYLIGPDSLCVCPFVPPPLRASTHPPTRPPVL